MSGHIPGEPILDDDFCLSAGYPIWFPIRKMYVLEDGWNREYR
ncbi:MAG: hypothetical protein SOR72_06700 [Hornefia sp.]|nr:hypothetical protein [Hornefia sp.]